MDLLITHLEEHLSHEIKTDLEKMIENIPKIKKTFDTILFKFWKRLYDKFQTSKMNIHRSGKFAVKSAQYTVYPTGTSQTPPVDQHKANCNNEQP